MRQLAFVKPRVLGWHEVPAPCLERPRQAIVAPVAAVVGSGLASAASSRGELVAVPAQISCGDYDRCRSGSTAFCRSLPPNSMYGLGPTVGDWSRSSSAGWR